MDIEFLRAVVPQNDGWFYLVRMPEPKRSGEYPKHRAVKAKDPQSGEWVEKSNGDHGIFFTPFTFNVDYITTAEGQKRNARQHDEHKLTCRLLWQDIDCGEGKTYGSVEDALAAVLPHCNGEKMPAPTYIISTGGGIHLYWVLDRELPLAEWQPIAEKFQQFWKNTSVDFDHISADSARILRVPGTNNVKKNEPRPCVRLAHQGAFISTEWHTLWPEAEKVSTSGNLEGVPVFGAAFAYGDKGMRGDDVRSEFFTAKIVEKCEIFRRIAADGGAACNEQLWKDVLQTVKMTEDCDEWAHKLSSGHEDYDPTTLQEKLNERKLDKGILCSTFASHFDDDPCDGCPLNCKGKSPLSMGKDKAPAVTESPISRQPDNLIRKTDGLYVVEPSKKEDMPDMHIKISNSQIIDFEAVNREEGAGVVRPFAKVTHFTGNQHRTSMLDMQVCARKTEGHQLMMGAGLSTQPQPDKLREAVLSWYDKLISHGDVSSVYNVNGWVTSHGRVIGFSHGPTLFRCDGTEEQSNDLGAGESDLRSFIPKGTPDKWTEAAEQILSDGRPEMAVILATAFAAPLVHIISSSGKPAALSFYSESGSGKSTAMNVAAGVWCTPKPTVAMDVTPAAVNNIVAAEPSMPLYWDEAKNEKQRTDAISMMFQVIQGHNSQRAQQHGGNRGVFKIDTVMVLGSNKSFAGEVSAGDVGSAEGKRLLEFRLGPAPGQIDEHPILELEDNYGAVGHEYARYLSTHRSELKQRLTTAKRLVHAKLNTDASDRFYVNALALLQIGAELAGELGFIDMDVNAMMDCLYRTVFETKKAVSDTLAEFTSAKNVLDFVADRPGISLKRLPGRGGASLLDSTDLV